MKHPWFKAKFFGWGWYPSSWQGWAVLAVWGLWMVGLAILADLGVRPLFFSVGVFAGIAVLFIICWKTGERPSWRWGGQPATATSVLLRVAAIVAYVAVLAALIAAFTPKF